MDNTDTQVHVSRSPDPSAFTAKIKQVSIAHVLSESMPFIVVKMQSAYLTNKQKKNKKQLQIEARIHNSVTIAQTSHMIPSEQSLFTSTNKDICKAEKKLCKGATKGELSGQH